MKLVETFGWYSPKNKKNNMNGVSRDHMVSVRFGFDNNIDPNLLSHPANCELLLQSTNASKHTQNSISIEELKERVKVWDEKYNLRKP